MLGKKGEMVEHPLRVELEGACKACPIQKQQQLFFSFFLFSHCWKTRLSLARWV